MKYFFRNKELSNPATIVNSCLKFLLDRITEDLNEERYHWDKPWGIKRFESIVLAKFILDFSFERMIDGQLSDDEIDREWDYYCQSICDNGHTK